MPLPIPAETMTDIDAALASMRYAHPALRRSLHELLGAGRVASAASLIADEIANCECERYYSDRADETRRRADQNKRAAVEIMHLLGVPWRDIGAAFVPWRGLSS